MTPTEVREQSLARRRAVEPIPLPRVEDRTIPGPAGEIPLRLYWPDAEPPLPALVYYHGGGWVLGDLDGSDPTTRAYASGAGVLVVSVDYRLAPEHPFPAAVDD